MTLARTENRIRADGAGRVKGAARADVGRADQPDARRQAHPFLHEQAGHRFGRLNADSDFAIKHVVLRLTVLLKRSDVGPVTFRRIAVERQLFLQQLREEL